MLFSNIYINRFICCELEKVRQWNHFVCDRHWVFNNLLLPLHNLSCFRWTSSYVNLLNASRKSFSITNLFLIFMIIKRSIWKELSKRGFGSNVDINTHCFKLWNCWWCILNLLDSSASHDDLIDIVSTKLLNKFVPVLWSVRIFDSLPEIRCNRARLKHI